MQTIEIKNNKYKSRNYWHVNNDTLFSTKPKFDSLQRLN